MTPDFVTFLGVATLVIVTPGQDTALTVRNALAAGRRGGFLTAVGVVCGQVVWSLASGAGVTALLLASRPLFEAVRLLGAAYLVYLGARSLWRAWAARAGGADAAARFRPSRLSSRTAFVQGLVSALGNAKLAVFFVSLLPQFVPDGPPAPPAIAALGLTFCAMTLVWLTGYALVVGRARSWVARPGLRRAAEATLGAVLVAFGIHIATEHR